MDGSAQTLLRARSTGSLAGIDHQVPSYCIPKHNASPACTGPVRALDVVRAIEDGLVEEHAVETSDHQRNDFAVEARRTPLKRIAKERWRHGKG